MSEKIYCGSGKSKIIELASGGKFEVYNCTINVDKIKDHIKEYEGTRFVKIKITKQKEKNKFDKDVTIEIDTYEPTRKDDVSSVKMANEVFDEKKTELPF